MQAGKRYTLFQTVRWTSRHLFLFLIIDAIVVAAYYFLRADVMVIPWQPISLIGIAVAFYLGFKNNSSYERLWEARKIWGGIVNASRSFTVMIRDFITNEFADEMRSEGELMDLHKAIVHRHIAWLHALTYQLRNLKEWEHHSKSDQEFRNFLVLSGGEERFDTLKEYLAEPEFEYVMSKGNRASHLLSLQSKQMRELKAQGLIDDFRHMEIQSLLTEFYTLQGKAERIKNFPFPRQYASANFNFVWIFIILLPFAMLSIFGNLENPNMLWMAIPATALVSWVFSTHCRPSRFFCFTSASSSTSALRSS